MPNLKKCSRILVSCLVCQVGKGKAERSNADNWTVVGRVSLSIIGALCLMPHFVQASEISTIWKNNNAVSLLKQEKKIEAYEEFSKLIGQDPFQPLFQFNMGAGFLATEEVEKAEKMYQEVIKTKGLQKPVAFASHFNLGALSGLKGNIEKALYYYQKALEFEPDSKEVKTNIELLIKQQKGGGKGKSDKKDKKKNQDQKNKNQQKEPQEFQNKPKQFNNKEMSTQDVKKILEELKKQEQRIRAKHQRKGQREKDREKNW